MSTIDRILGGLRDLIVMKEDLARLAGTARELANDIRDHERRLIRIETMIEMTRGGTTPALPEK